MGATGLHGCPLGFSVEALGVGKLQQGCGLADLGCAIVNTNGMLGNVQICIPLLFPSRQFLEAVPAWICRNEYLVHLTNQREAGSQQVGTIPRTRARCSLSNIRAEALLREQQKNVIQIMWTVSLFAVQEQ